MQKNKPEEHRAGKTGSLAAPDKVALPLQVSITLYHKKRRCQDERGKEEIKLSGKGCPGSGDSGYINRQGHG
jgi:hypothetical protein